MNKSKILVAQSGGVDSSTAAAILKEQGYYVEGATMWFEGVLEEDLDFAQKTCEKLAIRHRTLDFKEIYQQTVIDNFVEEYKIGRTPNPCVWCNKFIKFGLFLEKAESLGFDRIATGHYAGIVKTGETYTLKQGVDKNEQSYFLYRLDQYQLSKIIMPLCNHTKKQVRSLAKEYGLPTAQRKKSQDVCFLPDGDYARYFRKIMTFNPGSIISKHGKKIGDHKGIAFYTYGQRKGLGISHKKPYYVIKIDALKNVLYVGEKEDVYKRELIAGDLSFISGKELAGAVAVFAKARYNAPLALAIIEKIGDKVKVIFDKPQWALTPGQSVVFYQEGNVLGGGIIEEIVG